MKKKYFKDTMKLTSLGMGLGLSSQALGDAGSTYGQKAIGKISSKMPVLGGLQATGMVLDQVKKLNKKTKKVLK